MSDGDPHPPANKPEPGPQNSGLIGWLGNVNNFVSVIAAVAGSLAAILSVYNKAALERIDTKVKDLEFKQQLQKASSDYAQIFIDKVLSEERVKTSDKRVQAILSLLNIVAQASGSAEGESNARTRAMTPVVLALLLNEPGGVAQMDESYEYLDDWVAIACADNSIKTRVTALQALGGICQKAIRAGRLDIVVKTVRAFDQLMVLVPNDPKDPDYISVVAVRTQLQTFIKKEDRLLANATLPKGDKTFGDANALLDEVRGAFATADEAAQNTKAKVEARVASIEEGKSVKEQPGSEANKDLSALKGGLAQLNAALATASQVAQAQISQSSASPTPAASASASATGSAGPQATPIVTEGPSTIQKYIQDLQSEDSTVRRRSRTQLALLGQTAVKPLVSEIAARVSSNKEKDYRLRLGAAIAFHFMVQPITLDPSDSYWVVSLLRSNDADTRNNTAEFLMNLESATSLQNCLAELEKLFYEQVGSAKDGGNAVIDASVVVATWARNIGLETPSGVANTSMPQLALEKAQAWSEFLKHQPGDWKKTISSLDDLINRAATIRSKGTTVVAESTPQPQKKRK